MRGLVAVEAGRGAGAGIRAGPGVLFSLQPRSELRVAFNWVFDYPRRAGCAATGCRRFGIVRVIRREVVGVFLV